MSSKLPGLSHHEVKVSVGVDGGTDTTVVVDELFTSDLKEGGGGGEGGLD